MQANPDANHAAIAAWLEGSMTPAQRQEFEAHLATCVDCQAEAAAALKARIAPKREVAVPDDTGKARTPPRRAARRVWAIAIGAVLVLAIGYALGAWVWGLAHG
jgi:anti-sigma factor RsiW